MIADLFLIKIHDEENMQRSNPQISIEQMIKNLKLNVVISNEAEFKTANEAYHQKKIEKLDHEIEIETRYNPYFEKLLELQNEYIQIHEKIKEILNKMNEFDQKSYQQLAVEINNKLNKCMAMTKESQPEPNAIHALLNQTIQGEAKQFMSIFNSKIRSEPDFPAIQDWENKLNAYATTIKKIPNSKSKFESSLLTNCLEPIKELEESLARDTQAINLVNELREGAAKIQKIIEINMRTTAGIIRNKFPLDESNSNTNKDAQPVKQPYSPTSFQPTPPKTPNVPAESLTKQTSTMAVNGTRTSRK